MGKPGTIRTLQKNHGNNDAALVTILYRHFNAMFAGDNCRRVLAPYNCDKKSPFNSIVVVSNYDTRLLNHDVCTGEYA